MSRKIDRTGETVQNKQKLTMRIIKYRNNKSIDVEFLETGQIVTTTYFKFIHKQIVADLRKYPIRMEGGLTFTQTAKICGAILIPAIISIAVAVIAIFTTGE